MFSTLTSDGSGICQPSQFSNEFSFWPKFDYAHHYLSAFFCFSVMWHISLSLIGPLYISVLGAYLFQRSRVCFVYRVPRWTFLMRARSPSPASRCLINAYSHFRKCLAILSKVASLRRNMCMLLSCAYHVICTCRPFLYHYSPTTIIPLYNVPPCFPMSCLFTN